MLETTFWVPGKPRGKGSWRVVPSSSTGQPVFLGPKGLNAWQKTVHLAALAAWGLAPLEGAITVELVFHLPRPKTVMRAAPTGRFDGDGDHFERAVLDALTGVFYVDDAQVVACRWRKVYTDGEPGVYVMARLGEA